MCPMEPPGEDGGVGSPVLTPTSLSMRELREMVGAEDPSLSPARRAALERPGTVLLMAAQLNLDSRNHKVFNLFE